MRMHHKPNLNREKSIISASEVEQKKCRTEDPLM